MNSRLRGSKANLALTALKAIRASFDLTNPRRADSLLRLGIARFRRL
jgi:hypothetical protein